MKYLPSAVVSAQLDIARAAYFGGEFAVYMTQVPAVNLGQIDLSAAGVGTWTANPGSSINVAGSDLQIVPITPINSSAALSIVLAGLDTSGTPAAISLTATFAPPSRATNQTFNFARGFAQDLTVNPKVTHSTTRALASNVATITSPNHGYLTGQHVTTTLFGVSAYNVTNVAITVVDANTFTYAATGSNESTTADTTGTITPVGTTQLVSSITGLTSVTNGGPLQSFRVYQLPAVTDYELIQASTEIDFNTKDRPAKGIDAGMESDFWVKRGKAMPGELSIGSKFRSFTDGMARYSGQKCTSMLVGLKEGAVLSDRLVFTQWVGAIKPKLPDGDGEATMECAGKFVDHLFFVAP
jgi:hypothetical protein